MPESASHELPPASQELPWASYEELPPVCSVSHFSEEWTSNARDSSLKWALDKQGNMRYLGRGFYNTSAPAFSKLYRTFAGYQRSLANKHVVLIGDSRVRYQYMTLVHFLNTGRWLRCRDYDAINGQSNISGSGTDPDCDLIDSALKLSWPEWYTSSSIRLNDACDCSRPDPLSPPDIFENRYFTMAGPYGPMRITFLSSFIDLVKFHDAFPPLSWEPKPGHTPTFCKPGNCSHPASVSLTTGEALLEMVPKLNPTHVFANTGWQHNHGDNSEKFGCVLEKFRLENPGVEAFAMSHLWPRSPSRKAKLQPHGCNIKVLDRFTPTLGVPKTWYVDKIHALSIVNQELNHILLDAISGPVDDSFCGAVG